MKPKRLTPDEYLAMMEARPPHAEPLPPGSGTEAYLRRQSARDAHRAARNIWLLIGLVVLGIFILAVFVAPRPSYVHCTGLDYQTNCTDTRTGAEWP